MGIRQVRGFPGSSLWCVASHRQSPLPGSWTSKSARLFPVVHPGCSRRTTSGSKTSPTRCLRCAAATETAKWYASKYMYISKALRGQTFTRRRSHQTDNAFTVNGEVPSSVSIERADAMISYFTSVNSSGEGSIAQTYTQALIYKWNRTMHAFSSQPKLVLICRQFSL